MGLVSELRVKIQKLLLASSLVPTYLAIWQNTQKWEKGVHLTGVGLVCWQIRRRDKEEPERKTESRQPDIHRHTKGGRKKSEGQCVSLVRKVENRRGVWILFHCLQWGYCFLSEKGRVWFGEGLKKKIRKTEGLAWHVYPSFARDRKAQIKTISIRVVGF